MKFNTPNNLKQQRRQVRVLTVALFAARMLHIHGNQRLESNGETMTAAQQFHIITILIGLGPWSVTTAKKRGGSVTLMCGVLDFSLQNCPRCKTLSRSWNLPMAALCNIHALV